MMKIDFRVKEGVNQALFSAESGNQLFVHQRLFELRIHYRIGKQVSPESP
jgi:hypothetical protein